eukprot:TRINITY_DN12467_c0_g1_i1.p1 TRINITY_DN12467_c0_g1~~TRINITY_DN12467_c0_g1_i1.p1  ORF type:complete len:157 (-),score=44.83 TRINITY_DN12467_c0_g1_i1:92-562(-)
MELVNPNPTVHTQGFIPRKELKDTNDAVRDPIDSLEVFDLIRDITDPEHPHSLEQLKVLSLDNIEVDDAAGRIQINFAPTVPGCNMAPLIGLSLRVKLMHSLPRRFKVDIHIVPGTHQSEDAVNRQLNDKERVAAALENPNLLNVVQRCVEGSLEK